MIGQVDVDYVYHFKKMKDKTLDFYKDQIPLSIHHLLSFLQILCDQSNGKITPSQVVIHGVHLPPLCDQSFRNMLISHFVGRSKMDKDFVENNLQIPTHVFVFFFFFFILI
ncbi:hypothetical protein RFI_28301 [Reticulomyxa filosa]|uniref:Uncharacterized protein n=1 Tax=Reticulomyxa filosa TaxID=46433 RepID=X6M609_RETFI|nr:hypothetical protein RFI_28301 [Reticulomyxa filosa]|eukprot:ETO09086.1 hypothetical protein RFI_28301 [Reticulomyxa filosa]